MLKIILHLSVCLMITLALGPVKAEIRDADFPQGLCGEKMSKGDCVNHCKPQIANCTKEPGQEAYACCKHCMWPSEDLRRQGFPSTWISQCSGS